MFVKIGSVGMFGMNSYIVGVEASIDAALPRFDVVGLPDTAVSESRDRVRSAMKNNGFVFPAARITVNLTPADIKKEGPVYDLPICIALLKATKQLSCETDDSIFIGELSLSGEVRKITGALPMVIKAKEEGYKEVYLPESNAAESSVVKGIDIYPVKNIMELLFPAILSSTMGQITIYIDMFFASTLREGAWTSVVFATAASISIS